MRTHYKQCVAPKKTHIHCRKSLWKDLHENEAPHFRQLPNFVKTSTTKDSERSRRMEKSWRTNSLWKTFDVQQCSQMSHLPVSIGDGKRSIMLGCGECYLMKKKKREDFRASLIYILKYICIYFNKDLSHLKFFFSHMRKLIFSVFT